MIKIDLPWIEVDLLPNNADGLPWQALSRLKSKEKYDGKIAALSGGHALDPNQDHALSIVYFPPRNPGPDSDNLLKALKHRLDGIALGLGIDDRRFNPITITRGRSVAGGRVTVIIDDMPF